MAADSESISSALSQSNSHVLVDSDLHVDHSVPIALCALCEKALSPENEVTGELAPSGVCGDCTFLLSEDFGTPVQYSQRRLRGRFRYSSSESLDNILPRQLPHIFNTARQNQTSAIAEDDHSVDGDATAWLLPCVSTHTTPNESRRWIWGLSDTDSDGFDNRSSLYGENESNASFRRYRVPHGEIDSFSFSAYGGDSDVSMDRYSFVGTGAFNLPDEEDEYDSDTDIDPMHAGFSQWNSDEMEDEEEEDDGDEEEVAEAEEAEATDRLRTSSSSERGGLINWEQLINSPEPEGIIRRRIRDSRQTYNNHNYTNVETADLLPYDANFGDYLQGRQFEDFLEHLAEHDSTRRGAPPAAVSFVNSLPRIVISKEREKQEDFVCAICKDALAPGTEVNQLPCFHFYHPCCILPWLNARNSCPLCRYELPTDDKDYEERKRNTNARNEIHERQQLDATDDNFSDVSDGDEVYEEYSIDHAGTQHTELVNMSPVVHPYEARDGRGRWFFLAAAPIVSLVGIVLVLWLGNPLIDGSRRLNHCNLQNQHEVYVSDSPNQRENRSRRWWSFF